MDLNDLRSLVTLFGLLGFVVLAVWAWRPARSADLDQAAQLPFQGEAGFAAPGVVQGLGPGLGLGGKR